MFEPGSPTDHLSQCPEGMEGAMAELVSAESPEELRLGPLRLSTKAEGALQAVPSEYARDLAPATHCLWEWKEYLAECPGAARVRVGLDWAERVTDSLFRLRFDSQLGFARVQPFDTNGRPLRPPLQVEVLSAKFPGLAQHLGFLRTLLDDLFQRAARLPFTFSAPTARGVVESLRPPTPLFVLHFLVEYGPELAVALTTVQGAPHRKLVDRREYVPVAEVSDVEEEG